MLYGTGTMLQLSNMDLPPSLLKDILFEAFQIMEANRAIIYGVDTFLSEQQWVVTRRKQLLVSKGDGTAPMNDIITLMINMASFAKRHAQPYTTE